MTNGTIHIILRDAKKLKQYLNGELLEVNLFEKKGINLEVSLADVHSPTNEEFIALGFLPHSDKILLKRGGLELPKLIGRKTAERTETVGDMFSKLKMLTNATITPANPISDKKMNKMKNLLRTVLMHPAHNGNLNDLFEIIKELDADMKQGMEEVKEILSQYDEPTAIPQSGDIPPSIKAVDTESQRRRKERDARFAEEVLNLGGSLPDAQAIHEIVTTNLFQELDEAEAKFTKMPESEDEGWMLYHSEPPCIYCGRPVINSDEYNNKYQCHVHESCTLEQVQHANDSNAFKLEDARKVREIFADFMSKKTPNKLFIEGSAGLEKLTTSFRERFKGLHVNLLHHQILGNNWKALYLIHNGLNMAMIDLLFRQDGLIEINVNASTELIKYTSNLVMFKPNPDYVTPMHTYVNKNLGYVEDIFRFLYEVFYDHEGILLFDDVSPKLRISSKVEDNKYLLEPIE